MTDLADIIDARAVLPSVKAQGKKQLLQDLAQAMAKFVAVDHRIIFETLLTREKLGSTGIGQGIAIPHGKLAAINRVYGLFARLSTPIAYDSLDGQPVDLVFVLLAPDHAGADHLKALARISRLLRDPGATVQLRAARDAASLYSVLTRMPGAWRQSCEEDHHARTLFSNPAELFHLIKSFPHTDESGPAAGRIENDIG
mgnify:CR=1 FL=1